jgi:hypothetical protein
MRVVLPLRLAATVFAAAALALAGCGGHGGGGGASGGSSPSQGFYTGTVRDPSGAPVVGAQVSIDGIAALELTGPDGKYQISDPSLAVQPATGGVPDTVSSSQSTIAASASGFQPHFSTLVVAEGALADVDLVRLDLVPELVVTSPSGERVLMVPTSCASPTVLVEGFAGLGHRADYRLDVAIVIDKSGSTARQAFDVNGDGVIDTVLDVEMAAAQCFAAGLDYRTTRVSVVSFNDDAFVLTPFTSDPTTVAAAFAQVGGSIHGTNFEAAFDAARDQFLAVAAADAAAWVPAEAGDTPPPAPLRAVLFLTDGIPTSHGVPRDTSDSNLTQSPADRRAAIAAAQSLGQATGALLFGYAVIPADDPDRPRTTLPHCVAACGGGRFATIPDITQLEGVVCGESLTSYLGVTVANATTGSPALAPPLGPGGFFSVEVPVALVGTPDANGVVTNEIQVVVTAFPGDAPKVISQTVTVRLVSEAQVAVLDQDGIALAEQAPALVRDSDHIDQPEGPPVGNSYLYNFLAAPTTAEFWDAVELFGVDTFQVLDPTLTGATSVTVSVDFVYKNACYLSDVGYVVIDAARPPTTAAEALAGATPANILFNSVDVGGTACVEDSIAPGGPGAHHEIEFPVGTVVAFFILPNRTLAQYQANPGGGLAPLFTIPALNPGRFQQHLVFRSLAGRNAPGAPGTIVSPGPSIIFGWEDQATASRASDQDFKDIVFTVRNGVAGQIDALGCGP